MLILRIDNIWEPHDFVQVLSCVESMYYKLNDRSYRIPGRRYAFDFGQPDLFEPNFPIEVSYAQSLERINRILAERARFEMSPQDRLLVSRIQYASPGSIDLLGIGKACDSIANAIGRIVSYYDERHIRRERDKQATLETDRKSIETEKDQETLRSLKISNARNMLELERDFPDEAREHLLPLLVRDQDGLSELIADGRLVGVESKKK